MLNVVCRDTGVWQTCCDRLQEVFGRVLCQAIPNEVNRVLFCRKRLFNEEQGAKRKADAAAKRKHASLTDPARGIESLKITEEVEENLLYNFKCSIEKINNVLKSKNQRKNLLDIEEMLTCTNIL